MSDNCNNSHCTVEIGGYGIRNGQVAQRFIWATHLNSLTLKAGTVQSAQVWVSASWLLKET